MDSPNTAFTKRVDVYQIVTDRIVELLEQGTIPWQKPWTDAGMPANLISKRAYRGINLWLLLSLGYERNLFLTWDQIKKLGGSVKQGEHGHIVIYWKQPPKNESPKPEETTAQPRSPILRYYKVFNVSQCRDIPGDLIEPLEKSELLPVVHCEAIITGMPNAPDIRSLEPSAYYHIEEDYINMPMRESFKTIEGYYTTLFHELVHSTGHEKRLNRKSVMDMAEFGSELYSMEELIAELGAAYLASLTSIASDEFKNSAAYIEGWLKKLKSDKRFIVQASGQAQGAVDSILDLA